MGKKKKDFFDGRLVYEARVGEDFEIEVDENQYEHFRCFEGRDCKSCDLRFLTMDVCLNFSCTKAERSDALDVHFSWEGQDA